MSKTPWNWIVAAFVLAALFLVFFGMYKKETKNSNPTVITKLKEDNKRMSQEISTKDKVIGDRDRTITTLKRDLENERKKSHTVVTPVGTSDESVEQLKKKIEEKDMSIVSKNKKINHLRDSIQALKNYINSD